MSMMDKIYKEFDDEKRAFKKEQEFEVEERRIVFCCICGKEIEIGNSRYYKLRDKEIYSCHNSGCKTLMKNRYGYWN